VHRWIIKLVLFLEKAFRKRKRAVGRIWRVDEIYLKVKGQWKYLYRAVDKEGNTVDFLLRAHRDKAAALRYFRKAIDRNGEPETITVGKSGANLVALEALNAEGTMPIKVRQNKYLNHRRAGPPRRQTPHQNDVGIQGFPVRAHHPVRYRDHAYDSQGADRDDGITVTAADQFHSLACKQSAFIAGVLSSHLRYRDTALPGARAVREWVICDHECLGRTRTEPAR
jgi:putative transposase